LRNNTTKQNSHRTNKSAAPQKEERAKTFDRKRLQKALIALGVLAVLILSVVAGAALGFIDNSTDLIAQEYNLDFSSVVYYIDEETGQPMEYERLYAEQNRVWVDLENTPLHLKQAFIAIEDERFEKHKGVDWKRTFGATLGFIFKGNNSYGGSTITQQLIKNVTGNDKRSPIRKIQEIIRALNLEQKMTKDEIIEMYMNTIYLGQGCHGVQTASNAYFNKDVSKLSLAECASIAGITQYPAKYDPLLNFEAHKEKQETVLAKMLELGYITQEEHDAAVSEELQLIKGASIAANSNIQSYYIDRIVEEVMHDLTTRNKMTESDATKALFKGGLKIYANVDPAVQSAMEAVFTVDGNFPGGGNNKPQASMVVVDPYTGQIKGIVGGRGEKEGNRLLDRTTTLRQPGSAIKPLAVYAPAIETGLITPATLVDDTALTIGDWSPRNVDYAFLGPITARVALEKSRNIPAVRVLDKLGVNRSFDFMTGKLGFTSLVSSEKREDGKTYSDKNLSSLALGGLTDGVSVTEMAAAYACFVNGGTYTEPTTYTKVIDANGRVILENKPASHRAMSAETAYTMAQMLSGVVNYGTGSAARLSSGVFAGGKTGTTTGDIDRWFAGITPNYSGVVWFGYDSPKSMSGLGNPCVSVWKKVMDRIYKNVDAKTLLRPANLVDRVICQESGKIATDFCENVRTDFFKSGKQPNSFCESLHRPEPEEIIEETIPGEDPNNAENPPAEGEPNTNPDAGDDPSVPAVSVPETDDESQYWWSGDE